MHGRLKDLLVRADHAYHDEIDDDDDDECLLYSFTKWLNKAHARIASQRMGIAAMRMMTMSL